MTSCISIFFHKSTRGRDFKLKQEREKQYVVEREYKNIISKEELIRRIIKKHCNNND